MYDSVKFVDGLYREYLKKIAIEMYWLDYLYIEF